MSTDLKRALKGGKYMKVQEFGSVTLLVPGTEQELAWLLDNCNVEPWQMLGGALAVEPRMAEAIMEGYATGRHAFEEME